MIFFKLFNTNSINSHMLTHFFTPPLVKMKLMISYWDILGMIIFNLHWDFWYYCVYYSSLYLAFFPCIVRSKIRFYCLYKHLMNYYTMYMRNSHYSIWYMSKTLVIFSPFISITPLQKPLRTMTSSQVTQSAHHCLPIKPTLQNYSY